ncbi:VOC family protein [Nitratireductor luteus]|uniref:VOC family protein n=1 Tax=Nitratireductor luteus TaxID=2976980 RepID=UPI00223F482D|nr:VOC family protein [Nitratireductor luteus]
MSPKRHIGLVSLLVRDYDEAIAWYRDKLDFVLKEDTLLGGGKRWVVLSTGRGEAAACLLLARASGAEQLPAVGNQCGGRVFLFLNTDDFDRDHAAFSAKGVHFEEPPRLEAYGKVAVFRDIYGNRWDLIGPAASTG